MNAPLRRSAGVVVIAARRMVWQEKTPVPDVAS